MSPAPPDPAFRERVRASFDRQQFMSTLGAVLERVEPGEVDIALPVVPRLTQQHGFVHAGALAGVLDSACGYAAFTLMPADAAVLSIEFSLNSMDSTAAVTLMPADAAVLSIEFKLNLLEPARGERVLARARVVRAGRTVSVCRADAFALADGRETLVATLTGTMMCVRGRGLAG